MKPIAKPGADAAQILDAAPAVPSNKLIRLSIALVWLYEGLWCKVLGGVPHHEAVIEAVPFIGSAAGHITLIALGLLECGIGLWVLYGRWMRQAAIVQTALLIAMNTGGLIWAWHVIPDPGGMVLQNFAFVLLIWVATEDRRNAALA
jgi:uncharacterized membrane protein YphA (DoxX/SURF4 family)